MTPVAGVYSFLTGFALTSARETGQLHRVVMNLALAAELPMFAPAGFAQPIARRPAQVSLTLATESSSRPHALLVWAPMADGDWDPCARFPEMAYNGVPLNLHLSSILDTVVQRWSRLPDHPSSVIEAVRIKESALANITGLFARIVFPGADSSYIAWVTILCANFVRTLTALSNYLIDWQRQPSTSFPEGMTVRFTLCRYFAGFAAYDRSLLPAAMTPFGAGGKLCVIRRERPDDPRIMANLYASTEASASGAWVMLRSRLRTLLDEECLAPGDDYN